GSSRCGRPGAGAQQPQAVESDDDGGSLVAQHAEGKRQVPGEVPGDQGGDDGGGDHQVRGDDPAGAAGQPDDGRDGGQVVAHDDDVGGVQGQVRAGPAHGGTGADGGQGRGVVNPIPGQQHLAPGGFQVPDGLHLALGQQPGAHVSDAGLRGQPRGGPLVVPGQQQRGGAGHRGDLRDRAGGGAPDPVRDAEHGGRDAVNAHDRGSLPVGFQRGHRRTCLRVASGGGQVPGAAD